MNPTHHPNFPPNLSLTPLTPASTPDTLHQESRIKRYGIAGRVWDASYPILPYLQPPSTYTPVFSPPSSLFLPSTAHDHKTILELGSGQSLASLHLASHLTKDDLVILTDLDGVVGMCEENVVAWKTEQPGDTAEVRVRKLPWGDLPSGSSIAEELKSQNRHLTHILMIDLVYFPHLYPLLLRSLLQLTQPPFCPTPTASRGVTGPEVILTYKSRSLEWEEPFFLAVSAFFRLTRLLSSPPPNPPTDSSTPDLDYAQDLATPHPHGPTITYLLCRFASTVPKAEDEGWVPSERGVMIGEGGRKLGGGRDGVGGDGEAREEGDEEREFGWWEGVLGGIEWDG